MQIFVKLPNKKKISLQVQSTSTIDNVKQKIFNTERILQSDQRLIFEGKELKNERTLSHYDITNDATLDLALLTEGESLQAVLTEGAIVSAISAALVYSGLSDIKTLVLAGLGLVWWARNGDYFTQFTPPIPLQKLRANRRSFFEHLRYNQWLFPPDAWGSQPRNMVRSIRIHSEKAFDEYHKTGNLQPLKQICNYVVIDRLEGTQQVILSWAMRSMTQEAIQICLKNKIIDCHARVEDRPPISPAVLAKMKQIVQARGGSIATASGTGYYGVMLAVDPSLGVAAAYTGNTEFLEFLRTIDGYSDSYLVPTVTTKIAENHYTSYSGSPCSVEEALMAVEQAKLEPVTEQ